MRPAVNRLNNHNFRLAPIASTPQFAEIGSNLITNRNSKLAGTSDANLCANFLILTRSHSTKLAEVGRFETKQSDENCYPAGQPFLHRIFGYRGITLFPWLAKVHDIDVRKQFSEDNTAKGGHGRTESHNQPNNNKHIQNHNHQHHPYQHAYNRASDSSTTNDMNNKDDQGNDMLPPSYYATGSHKSSTKFHPYYQVLIDARDCPHVSARTQTEAVTFLGHPDNSKSVYSIKGLDYVAHEDILPYTSFEEKPIQHDLHGKLFKFDADSTSPCKFGPSELLESWRNKHPWLELSRVYRETTENIRVTVIPFYLGHTTIEETSFHWWRYCVRLENFSDVSVQLRERHWKIFSQTNMLQTIKGRGVVGVEPLLTKSEPAYQYSSHVNLQDKSGHMWGTFKLQREDGHTFECKIPPFSLESSIEPITT